jgi:hypothetical protein
MLDTTRHFAANPELKNVCGKKPFKKVFKMY